MGSHRSTGTHISTRIAPAIGVAALLVGVLAGCVPEPASTSSPSAVSTPTEQPSATITPSPTPTTGTAAQPVSIACTSLITLQQMYDFNPNFSLQASYAPTSGTPAYAAKADGGTACNWINDSSGDALTISVARPGSIEFASLKTAAAGGTAVTGVGDSAFFGGNALTVFSGDYWLVAKSTFFTTAADAKSLASEALAAVK